MTQLDDYQSKKGPTTGMDGLVAAFMANKTYGPVLSLKKKSEIGENILTFYYYTICDRP